MNDRPVLLSIVTLFLVPAGCGSLFSAAPLEQDAALHWYKGNTHAHTVLSGHADSSPEHVAAWYHDRACNFLILSEHNIFIDPRDGIQTRPTLKSP